MPKRYTNTDKWEEKWFRLLDPAEKVAWFYIVDNCNDVGVWDVDYDLGNFLIGQAINWDVFLKKVSDKVCEISNDKWRIKGFRDYIRYEEYLQSSHWKTLRKIMLESAGWKCKLCEAKGNLHVHHLNYENLGEELISDLVVLCNPCHRKIHGKSCN